MYSNGFFSDIFFRAGLQTIKTCIFISRTVTDFLDGKI